MSGRLLREARALLVSPAAGDNCHSGGTECSRTNGLCWTHQKVAFVASLDASQPSQPSDAAKCSCTHATEQHTRDGCMVVGMMRGPCPCKWNGREVAPQPSDDTGTWNRAIEAAAKVASNHCERGAGDCIECNIRRNIRSLLKPEGTSPKETDKP